MSSLVKAAAAIALGCLIIQFIGCVSSSTLVDKWQDPSYKNPPLSKMLVIAVRKDATKRRIWEDAFAGELAKHGVAATSSYNLFPDAPPDTTQVIASVKENGFDGILAILKGRTETNKQVTPGYTTQIQDVRYNPYWDRYGTFYREIVHPGCVDSQKVDLRAIDVTATVNGGRLIWSATSKTPDPASVTDVQRGIADLVISELTRRSIILSKN